VIHILGVIIERRKKCRDDAPPAYEVATRDNSIASPSGAIDDESSRQPTGEILLTSSFVMLNLPLPTYEEASRDIENSRLSSSAFEIPTIDGKTSITPSTNYITLSIPPSYEDAVSNKYFK